MCEIYVLTLEGGKFYVGKTNNVSKRYREHLSGYKSSSWTKKYRPIGIEKVYHDADALDEDKITVQYMMMYGIENVRGGPYVSIKLPEDTKRHIQQRIRMASDLCVRCGSSSHFVMSCDKNNANAVPIYPTIVDTVDTVDTDTPRCESCGSEHHFTEDCVFKQCEFKL